MLTTVLQTRDSSLNKIQSQLGLAGQVREGGVEGVGTGGSNQGQLAGGRGDRRLALGVH